jgi:signal recognition particle subunit SRP54
MFGALTEKFQDLFSKFSSKKTLTEESLSNVVREVRLALLDADVNYSVAAQFVKKVKEKAVGVDLVKSVSPRDLFISIVHDELVELMGKEESTLHLEGHPSVFLMCGLQGSGKTTQSAKLAHYLIKEHSKKVLLVACDLQRPAAALQLKKLADQVQTPVFIIEGETDPVVVGKEALKKAKNEGIDIVIIDTAGRLHIDDDLMKQLEKLKKVTEPDEVLFVANATTGQDAVKTAEQFDIRIGITGTILTMLDGNARAGAAISIREITKKPLKFEGVGEKITDFQPFNARSMADRILGMGDVINLVRKAKQHVDEEETKDMEEKLRKASFTYGDYLKQIGKIKKMGSIKNLLKMIPGLSNMDSMEFSDEEFSKLEAMILSMTTEERLGLDELLPSRRRRIANGSGVTVDDVNRMVKGFKRLKQMMKQMPKMKKDFLKDPQMMSKMTQGKSLF